MKAMVIDDSRALRMVVGRILEELGYQVFQASDGQAGLDLLREVGEGLAVVLVDWNMPGMNGYEFVCAFRRLTRYADVPVMMVTSESDLEQVEKAVRAGANEYLMKPFTPDGLKAKLMMLGAA